MYTFIELLTENEFSRIFYPITKDDNFKVTKMELITGLVEYFFEQLIWTERISLDFIFFNSRRHVWSVKSIHKHKSFTHFKVAKKKLFCHLFTTWIQVKNFFFSLIYHLNTLGKYLKKEVCKKYSFKKEVGKSIIRSVDGCGTISKKRL